MKFRTFSIRSLLIVTFLVAIFLALPFGQAVRQKRGREWVASQRGHVYFEHTFDHATGLYQIPYVPQFFIQLLAVDLFNPVRTVVFDCDELVDLEPIKTMPTIQTIVVNIEMAKTIDLTPLAELPMLKEIHFTEWSLITNEQLEEMKTLTPNVKIITQ